MSTKLEELLKESVKEIERRKQELLNECEAIEKVIKEKENNANKRISQLEEESEKYIANAQKEADAKLEEAKAIRKSLEGSEETLQSIADGLSKLDTDREALSEERKAFDKHMVQENQKLDEKSKAIELRETKLNEA